MLFRRMHQLKPIDVLIQIDTRQEDVERIHKVSISFVIFFFTFSLIEFKIKAASFIEEK